MSTNHEVRIAVDSRAKADLITSWLEEGEARKMLDFAFTVTVGAPRLPVPTSKPAAPIDLLRERLQRMVAIFDRLPSDWQRHFAGSVRASVDAIEATTPPTPVTLRALADAIPLGESDYGTHEHIDAENEFTEALRLVLPDDLFAKFEGYALKANTSEMIDYAMELVEQIARAQVTSEIPAAALDDVSIDLQ